MFAKIKNYFFTGILVTAPVVITFWIVFSLVKLFDQLITPIIPPYINPNFYLPRDVPGLGLIILFLFLVLVGFLTANFFGSYILKKTEQIIQKIPLIKVFHKTIKQILETILKTNSSAFRDAVLLEYPRKGVWVIGFTTGEVKGAVKKKINLNMVNVFVPTTPNPTSGFLLMVPRNQIKYLDVKVDDAIKTIVSAGIIQLDSKQKDSS
tara:strand:- start:803 stop:1426 length:624 start_codon:yes stop_codon:yes gene_type:complete